MKIKILIFFFVPFYFFNDFAIGQTLKEDSLALVDFYNNTGGSTWNVKTNWLVGRVSTWYGVTISGGRVTRIALSANNLTGSVSEAFKKLDGLTHLYLNTNSLSKLDISNCPNLLLLFANNNKIEEFVTNASPNFYGKLADLRLYENKFKSIDISNMINLGVCWLTGMNEIKTNPTPGYYLKLTQFYAHSGGLTSIDISGMPSLAHFQVHSNQIKRLDISHLSSLVLLYAHSNQLEEFVTSTLPNFYGRLADLRIFSNKFRSIDISNMPSIGICWLTGMNEIKTNTTPGYYSKLTQFYAHSGDLSSIDISGMSSLAHLQVHSNQIKYLDISHLSSLVLLYAHNNQLEEFVTSTLPDFYGKLADLRIYSNKFKSIDISNMPSLGICQLTGMNEIKTNPTPSYYSKLAQFYAHSGGLTSIDISGMPFLAHLQIHSNQLKWLDISRLSSLVLLYAHSNQLEDFVTNTSVNFYGKLSDLRLYTNKFKTIDISNMPSLAICQLTGMSEIKTNSSPGYYLKLAQLYTPSGNLTSIDISGMPSLAHLQVHSNKLKHLNISHLSSLVLLYAHNNQLEEFVTGTSLNFYQNLSDLRLYTNKFKSIDISNMPSLRICHLTGMNEIKTNSSFNYYPKLTQLYAPSGRLISLDISGMPALTHLQLQSNALTFEDIEPFSARPFTSFVYSPQGSINLIFDKTNSTFSVRVGGTNNKYQWKKNGVNIPGATSSSYSITAVEHTANTQYQCVITNTVVTGLTLNSVIKRPQDSFTDLSSTYYISKTSGNWDDNTTWQLFDGSGYIDAQVGEIPGEGSPVYLQENHTITLNINASCKDLHLSATADVIRLNTGENTLDVYGKLRSYTGTVPGTSSTSAGVPNWITTGTNGRIRLKGTTNRVITEKDEFSDHENLKGWTLECHLAEGVIGTINSNFRAGNVIITSGNLEVKSKNFKVNR